MYSTDTVYNVSDCQLPSTAVNRTVAPLADNVVAAWRSGGGHCRSCGILTSKFARNVQRSYTRHCAKPPVTCCRIGRSFCRSTRQNCTLFSVKYYFRASFIACTFVARSNEYVLLFKLHISYSCSAFSRYFLELSHLSLKPI